MSQRCEHCGEPVEVVGQSRLGGDLIRCGCTAPPTEDQSPLERAARRGRDAAGIASPEGLGTTPGPPEPTQGDEWDRAVDAVVEALVREVLSSPMLPRAARGYRQATADFITAWAERFKGAARDTGGRSG